LALVSAAAGGQTGTGCGFPWTITASPAGGDTLAIHVCGEFAGCFPHDPEFVVSGSEIRIEFKGGEFPDRCSCVQVHGFFTQTLIVGPVSPGDYSVTVTFLNCLERSVMATGIVRFEGIAAVPTLGWRGLTLFGLLLAVIALRRLPLGGGGSA